jgi:hypothetical protein
MSENIEDKTFCYKHPERETSLRCNRCEQLICTQCAVLTPTGYRCKDCVRGQQKIFNTAQVQDYIFGIAVAALLGYLGAILVRFVGFFVFFVSPAIGVGIAEAVRWVVKRRRAKSLYQSVTAAAVIGALFNSLPALLGLLFGSFDLFGLLWSGIYIAFMAGSLYMRLSGIQIRR